MSATTFTPTSWNCETDGVRRRYGSYWRNYHDGREWRRMDLAPRGDSGGLIADRVPLEAHFPRRADMAVGIVASNRFNPFGRRFVTERPLAIGMVPLGVRPVALHTGGGKAVYPEAYGHGVDLVWDLVRKPYVGPRKVLRFWRAPRSKYFLARYLLDLPHDCELRSTPRGPQVRRRDSDEWRSITFPTPRIWDASGRSQPIRSRVRRESTGWVLTKFIPRSFFADAVYPVCADYLPDPGTGSTTCDGHMSATSVISWADVRAATVGTPAASSTTGSSESRDQTTAWDMKRFHNGYAVDETGTVTASTLTLSIIDGDDGSGDNYTALVQSSPADDNTLAVGDYDGFGATEWSDQVSIASAISSLPSAADRVWTLNSTGLAAIPVGSPGIFNIGMRVSDDINNSAPGTGVRDRVSVATADTTGTDSDPLLEITTSGGGGATVPIFMESYRRRRG